MSLSLFLAMLKIGSIKYISSLLHAIKENTAFNVVYISMAFSINNTSLFYYYLFCVSDYLTRAEKQMNVNVAFLFCLFLLLQQTYFWRIWHPNIFKHIYIYIYNDIYLYTPHFDWFIESWLNMEEIFGFIIN